MESKQPKFLTDKRGISDKFGNKDLLTKKIPKNSKFDDIKPAVNTGKTIKNVVCESDQLISKKKSELFKRVKGGAIVKLMSEVTLTESIYNLGKDDNNCENELNNINLNSNNVRINKKLKLLYQLYSLNYQILRVQHLMFQKQIV